MEHNRGQWSNNVVFILAAIGSAIGMGNLWGFPYKMGANGGFYFLIIYLVMVVLCGVIVMGVEMAIGRNTGKSPILALSTLSKKWKFVGMFGTACAFIIMGFYSVLIGYAIRYFVGFVVNTEKSFVPESKPADNCIVGRFRNYYHGASEAPEIGLYGKGAFSVLFRKVNVPVKILCGIIVGEGEIGDAAEVKDGVFRFGVIYFYAVYINGVGNKRCLVVFRVLCGFVYGKVSDVIVFRMCGNEKPFALYP